MGVTDFAIIDNKVMPVTGSKRRGQAMKGHDEISIYRIIDQRSLAQARRAYRQTYRRSHDDKAIDAGIELCFLDWVNEPGPLRVPAYLVLALLLREGFAGRGRGHGRTTWQRISAAHALQPFRKLRDKLKAAGKPASYARDKAAEEISKHSGLPVETILDGRPNRKRRMKK